MKTYRNIIVGFLAACCILSTLSCSCINQDVKSEKKAALSEKKISEVPDNPFLLHGNDNFLIERPIEDGIIHRTEWRKEVPLYFNALTIDLTKPHISIELEKGQDQLFKGEKVASIAKRETSPGHRVIAATNGDFWGTGYTPVGLFVDDDTIYKCPYPKGRSVFMMDKQGVPHIARVEMKVTINVENEKLPINNINVNFENNKNGDDVMLFTSRHGTPVKFDSKECVFILEKNDKEFLPNKACSVTVKEIREIDAELDVPAENIFYLTVKEELAKKYKKILEKGKKATILAKLTEIDKPIVLAIGGIPRILRDGKVSVECDKESIRESFSTTKHPRTAIGYSKDKKKLFLVVVDGRQPSLSIGQNLADLAEYMKKLGAWDAMNLDGGGSSTMWVRGKMASSPSDSSGPRTVTNSILIVSSADKGDAAHIDIGPDDMMIPAGTEILFKPAVYDRNYTPLNIDEKEIEWTVSGDIGTIKNGIFHASRISSSDEITAKIKGTGLSDTIEIDILDIKKFNVSPDTIMMKCGEAKKINLSATASENRNLFISPSMIKVKITDGIIWNSETSEIKAEKAGKHSITLKTGSHEKTIPVYVDHFEEKITESFDNADIVKLTMKNAAKEKTNISQEIKNKKHGNESLRVNYKMTPGGTSAIYLNMDCKIPGEPYSVGFWIYGDGKEQWLRGFLEDADGEEFIADFTNGTKGIFWKDEWRFVEVEVSKLKAKWSNPGAKLNFPLKMKLLYLVQTREAKKSDGSILIDALTATYPKD
jgi:uncharacterized protein YigE (DUF2233 family)